MSTKHVCGFRVDDSAVVVLQPVLVDAVDYFFGADARVPAATNLHDRLMDLLLTAMSFSLEDPSEYTVPFLPVLPRHALPKHASVQVRREKTPPHVCGLLLCFDSGLH